MIGTTPCLEVATLGRFELRRNADPLSGGNWSRRKVVDLFKLLLSAEQHRLHREAVARAPRDKRAVFPAAGCR